MQTLIVTVDLHRKFWVGREELVGCQNCENMEIKLKWFIEFIGVVVMSFTIVATCKKFISEFFLLLSNKGVF